MNRRSLLLGTAAGASWLAAPRWARAMALGLGAQDAQTARPDRRLVVLFLDGGNDGLNTLVPVADDLYHRARPALALKSNKIHSIDAACGLHPALARMAVRYRAGGIGFVRGVGYPDPNLSHFRAKDIWASGATASPSPATGWLGRFADHTLPPDAPATAVVSLGQVTTPHALRAERHVAYALADREGFRVRAAAESRGNPPGSRQRVVDAINRRAADARLRPVGESVLAADQSIAAIDRALRTGPKARYPESRLAQDLEMAARLIEADLGARCLFTAHHGYDTHASQADTHHHLLYILDHALDAFLEDLAKINRHASTLVLVLTEFGRRVAENGNGATAGTDHGSCALLLTAGGGVKPGLHGPAPDLADLDPNGNQRHAIDFRSVYADVIGGWFGADVAAVLGAPFARAGVLG